MIANLPFLSSELSKACRDFNISVEIGRDPRSRKYRAMPVPSGVLLPVTLGDSVRIGQFVALNEDLDRRLQILRPELRLSIIRRPLSVEIREEGEVRDPLILTTQVLDKLPYKKFQGIPGVAIQFEGSFIPVCDITQPDLAHILYLGATGSGKTTAMVATVLSMVYRTPPQELPIVLIDPKRRGLPPLSPLPHVIAEAFTPEDIILLVKWVEQEVADRVQNPKDTRLLVVMDELSEILRIDPSLQGSLTSAARLGRELGVHLFGADQRPMGGNLGGDFLQQFGGKIVGRLRTSRESSDILGSPDPTLVHLAGAGSMVYFPPGKQQIKIQTFLPDRDRIVASLSSQPKNDQLDFRSLVRIEEKKPKFDVEQDLNEIRPILETYYNLETNEMKRGGYSRCATALGSDYGGSTITRIALALELWKDQIQ